MSNEFVPIRKLDVKIAKKLFSTLVIGSDIGEGIVTRVDEEKEEADICYSTAAENCVVCSEKLNCPVAKLMI
jgi:hypothetical protein